MYSQTLVCFPRSGWPTDSCNREILYCQLSALVCWLTLCRCSSVIRSYLHSHLACFGKMNKVIWNKLWSYQYLDWKKSRGIQNRKKYKLVILITWGNLRVNLSFMGYSAFNRKSSCSMYNSTSIWQPAPKLIRTGSFKNEKEHVVMGGGSLTLPKSTQDLWKKDKTGSIATDDLSIDYEQRKSDKNCFLKNLER